MSLTRKAYKSTRKTKVLRPIPGPQERFLASSADYLIYGGGVGGGKTYAILLDALRGTFSPGFKAIIFRRTNGELMSGGGLWDSSRQAFSGFGLTSRENKGALDWRRVDTDSKIEFRAMHQESDRYKYKGGQFTAIYFDELDTFTEKQWTFMGTRNRNAQCTLRPYMRGTCNPSESSWVLDWVSIWCRPSHALYGKVKYGELVWFRYFEDEVDPEVVPYILHREPEGCRGHNLVIVSKECPDAKSLTYLPANMQDNPYFGADYRASIAALGKVERIRSQGIHPQCWMIRPSSGNVFSADDFRYLTAEQSIELMPRYEKTVRSWDLGSTAGGGDYTCGVKVGITKEGALGVIDVVRGQWSAAMVEQQIKLAANQDGPQTEILIEQEFGAAGANLVGVYASMLPNHRVTAVKLTGDKVVRSAKASARVEQGVVSLHHGVWVQEFANEHDGFPDGRYDDQVDGFGGAVNHLNPPKPVKIRRLAFKRRF